MPPEDAAAFVQALEPLRGAIRLHCYRMLGSAHDGDDVVQETMLRAWRAQDTLGDRSRLKPWLYRIATNVCLDELKRRPRRLYPSDAFSAAEDARPPLPRIEEPVWLEPMPNSWLEGVDEGDPQARYALKESVALAFVAALQCLSPGQRATLLLRDVVGLSAAETAKVLGTSVEAANSALFRARTALGDRDRHAGGGGDRGAAVDEELLERYVRAFEDADLDEIVALFHEDMRTTMPPATTWISGRRANERFYRTMFGTLVPGQFRHLHIGANGQPALAFYRPPPDMPGAPHELAAIQLVATREGAIFAVDHFMLPEVYPLFDVPRVLAP
jgi:RNA polymerase sigma-70 factor, ECF subfamily